MFPPSSEKEMGYCFSEDGGIFGFITEERVCRSEQKERKRRGETGERENCQREYMDNEEDGKERYMTVGGPWIKIMTLQFDLCLGFLRGTFDGKGGRDELFVNKERQLAVG
eukprot:GHVS01061072.1.p4 GENE.GHVS01061072.1~~GHVS01061072.1.p4  ORF type:complete len:111 (+),score=24.04 GHVS01061072.1:264-596(+)